MALEYIVRSFKFESKMMNPRVLKEAEQLKREFFLERRGILQPASRKFASATVARI
jgi:hypothetical protein